MFLPVIAGEEETHHIEVLAIGIDLEDSARPRRKRAADLHVAQLGGATGQRPVEQVRG